MGGIGTTEMFLLLAIGVLLFGSRLPEVAKSIGRSVFEFKKGLNDMGGKEIKEVFNFDVSAPAPAPKKEDVQETAAQKFEPPAEDSESVPEETVPESDEKPVEALSRSENDH
ncbi:MAG: twin-arginine translocase TatA/TatE family subunit [Planctomycetaceae bacterium]|jgi:sec-independent protein translocase protein TatA|nr:twin-arginine translocase TatA/TatE family subunit [Planctomycetaceae bacterium]